MVEYVLYIDTNYNRFIWQQQYNTIPADESQKSSGVIKPPTSNVLGGREDSQITRMSIVMVNLAISQLEKQ
jgi:hypothetical protein